jgi:hypothetical protein
LTPEQYAAAQAVITAQAVKYVGGFGKLFLPFGMGVREWLGLLELLWPAVKQYRDESATLARTFYDQQRDMWHPQVPNHARLLEPYEFQWFVQDMEPVRKVMSVEDASPKALEQVQLQVARSVENGGRRQIIHAVQTDYQLDDVPQPDEPVEREVGSDAFWDAIDKQIADIKKPLTRGGSGSIRGWARVATGKETCEWCLMLVARGPVYESARTAGLNIDDSDIIINDDAVNGAMNEWHAGCDCKVVPVFKETNWVGADAAQRALDFWITAGKRATKELEANPDKQYYSVKERRWKKTTDNRETINQLRQMIDNGEIKSTDWNALQVA